jgi:hypothetical protein
MLTIKEELTKNGYAIIQNILTENEVSQSKQMFYNWKNTLPKHDENHRKYDPHGIYKFQEVGHQEHAWFIRTRPKVKEVFSKIWDTDNLAVSFDGCCWLKPDTVIKDNFWCHTDQSPTQEGLKCYQGLVALTDNKERTLVVWEKTHTIHKEYYESIGKKDSPERWQPVSKTHEESLKPLRRVLHIPAGAIAIWDSRLFHQNQYGGTCGEERLVQYVCMLPKNSQSYEKAKEKRKKYFEEKRTTSHWPYPLKVNGKQPQTYGDKSLIISYDSLREPKLNLLLTEIQDLL